MGDTTRVPDSRYVSTRAATGTATGTGNGAAMSETESTDFDVETIDGGSSVVVIAVHGQADLHTAPELRNAIGAALDGGANSLVIDLSEATFIDSMTLGVLLGAVKRLRPTGGKVTIVCVDPHIRRIFEITLLDRVFSLHASRDEARAIANGGV
jgi:anti-sigma B factor antagonist